MKFGSIFLVLIFFYLFFSAPERRRRPIKQWPYRRVGWFYSCPSTLICRPITSASRRPCPPACGWDAMG